MDSFDVYHMKCNSTQNRTVYELSAIQMKGGRVAKSPFLAKSVQKSLKIKNKKPLAGAFFKKSAFLKIAWITQKRFIF